MATRIRKLAKELARSPEEILGLLKALGFDKYKTPEDMLSDAVVEKVHGGIRDGVRPLPVMVAAKAAPRVVESAPSRAGLMEQLVPGVVRAGARPVTAARPAAKSTTPAEAPPAPRIVAETPAISEERRALASAKEALAVERAAAEAALQALEASRLALEAAREAAADTVPGTPLVALLAERGLFGADEFERAIGALASAHALRELLPQLLVRDPAGLRRVLRDRLVLVGGEPLDAVLRSASPVAVAPDRAEVPDATVLKRDLSRIGEQLLLAGWRRVAVVGGRPLWHRVLREGLDARVELRFEPSLQRLENADPRPDVVVVWALSPPADALAALRCTVVAVPNADLASFLSAMLTALSAGS